MQESEVVSAERLEGHEKERGAEKDRATVADYIFKITPNQRYARRYLGNLPYSRAVCGMFTAHGTITSSPVRLGAPMASSEE